MCIHRTGWTRPGRRLRGCPRIKDWSRWRWNNVSQMSSRSIVIHAHVLDVLKQRVVSMGQDTGKWRKAGSRRKKVCDVLLLIIAGWERTISRSLEEKSPSYSLRKWPPRSAYVLIDLHVSSSATRGYSVPEVRATTSAKMISRWWLSFYVLETSMIFFIKCQDEISCTTEAAEMTDILTTVSSRLIHWVG